MVFSNVLYVLYLLWWPCIVTQNDILIHYLWWFHKIRSLDYLWWSNKITSPSNRCGSDLSLCKYTLSWPHNDKITPRCISQNIHAVKWCMNKNHKLMEKIRIEQKFPFTPYPSTPTTYLQLTFNSWPNTACNHFIFVDLISC
jgi:hypothetical protein